jgi:dephospho-CoA kinase
MKRDGGDAEDARRKVATQLSFEEKKAEADFVIDTSGEKATTLAEADRLADQIKARAAARVA